MTNAVSQVTFVPMLALSSQLCPLSVKGSLFTSLMSVYNASGVALSEHGAQLTSALGVTDSNFDCHWLLVRLCGFSYLLLLPLLRFVDRAPSNAPEDPVTDLLNGTTSNIAHCQH